MKGIVFMAFIVLFAICDGVSAQTAPLQRSFENGIILAHSGDLEAALAEFGNSLKLAENERVSNKLLSSIHFNIGVCLYRTGRYGEAVNEFEQAIRYHKAYEKAYYALGMTEAERGNWDAAESAFRKAVHINQRNGEAWFDLAYVYLAKNNLRAALAAFERSTKYKSVDSAIGHNNIGVIRAMNGDLSRAEAEFETALRESGGGLEAARSNLFICRQRNGKLSKEIVAKLEFGRAARTLGE